MRFFRLASPKKHPFYVSLLTLFHFSRLKFLISLTLCTKTAIITGKCLHGV